MESVLCFMSFYGSNVSAKNKQTDRQIEIKPITPSVTPDAWSFCYKRRSRRISLYEIVYIMYSIMYPR